MEVLFWLCAFAILYPYVVFPVTLWVCSRFVTRHRQQATVEVDIVEPFTVIIPAHNEEAHVARKIREIIPSLEIHPENALLIVSDHSSDNTIDVASAIEHPQVQVVENKLGRGRALATNFAVGLARNEFLIFTDVETRVPAETIGTMVKVLRQEHVGCVNA